ncbi:MAG: hypothetical protein QXJ81_02675 [Metallosphaera sp.]
MLRVLGLSSITFNEFVERVSVTILNALLFYSISSYLNVTQYFFFGEGVVIVLSALLPYVLAPALTLLYVTSYSFGSLILGRAQMISIKSVEDFISMLILLVIIPIAIEAKFTSLQGFVTSESLVGPSISFLFLGVGLAEKGRDIRSNLVAALPVLYIPIDRVLNSSSLNYTFVIFYIIGFLLFLASALLFSQNGPLSISGLIPLYVGIALVTGEGFTSENAILPTGLAAIVNAIPTGVNLISSVSQGKSVFQKEKNEILNAIDLKLRLVNSIKTGSASLPQDLVKALDLYEQSLKEQSSKVSECTDNSCLNERRREYLEVSESLDKTINDTIFKIIIDYNSKVSNLRKYGINMEELQIPPQLKISDTDINIITKILITIDRNTFLVTNKVNQVLEGLEAVIGGNYSRVIITDFSSLDKLTLVLGDKTVIGRIEECLSIQADLLRELRMSSFSDEKIKLSRKVNQLLIEQFSLDKLQSSINVSKESVNLLNKYILYLANKKEELYKIALPEVKDYIKTLEELSRAMKENIPSCEVIKRSFSLLNLLNDVDTIVSDIDSISALSQLLESLTDVINYKINEEGCIKMAELGIDPKYGRYIVSWLKGTGVNATIKEGSICKG